MDKVNKQTVQPALLPKAWAKASLGSLGSLGSLSLLGSLKI